jgi:adenylate cyclase
MIRRQVGVERKLTAILCADVYGYSRLMGGDEEATLATLTSHRRIIDSLIERHHGRFVNSAGDSVLAEFASVVEAVNCAVDIQTALKAENAKLPSEHRMEFRIGVNLGDVMVEGDQIYGDRVNVAARLESLADPGGICISGTVHEQVRDKLALGYEDRGEQTVKNITRPVRVWRVLLDGSASPRPELRRAPRRHWHAGVFSFVGLAIIASTIVIVQHLSLRPQPTHASIPPPPSAAVPIVQPSTLPFPDKPSIAVLPFANVSGDPTQEYFSDGVTDQLITDLSKLPGLFVIDRNSSFTYKGKAVKAQEVSLELGVRLVLEGSTRKTPDGVRIAVELVDATTGANIWAERFDRPLRDIFAVQDEIVQKIVTTLDLEFKLGERGIPAGVRLQGTDKVEAFDDVLRGTLVRLEPDPRGKRESSRDV